MTAPAQHGKHWLTEVIPAVRHDVGSFSGSLAELLLEQTAPFEPPTREFDLAAIEYARRLDAQIAAARRAEQQRLAADDVPPSRWERARRYVRDNWTAVRAAFFAGSVAAFVGAGIGWLVAR